MATVVMLPEPRSPVVCQSSTNSMSDIGTMVMTGSGSAPSRRITAAASIQCAWCAPLTNGHRPLRR